MAAEAEHEQMLEPAEAGGEAEVEAAEAAAAGTETGVSADEHNTVLTTQQASTDLACVEDAGAFISGVKTERARITAILGDVLPGHEKLALAAAIETPMDHGEFLQAQTRAERQVRADRVNNLAVDEAQVNGLRSLHGTPANQPSPEGKADKHAGLQGEDLWSAQYADDKALQAEFADKASYLAYMRRQPAAA